MSKNQGAKVTHIHRIKGVGYHFTDIRDLETFKRVVNAINNKNKKAFDKVIKEEGMITKELLNNINKYAGIELLEEVKEEK